MSRFSWPPLQGKLGGISELRQRLTAIPRPRFPRLHAPRLRPWPRPPLPITATVMALLVVLPVVGLLRWPRPRAVGLERLMVSASLMQSFPGTPDRPVPRLWQERLGPGLAERLWRQQRHSWWQFWGSHAEGAPLLALQATSLQGAHPTLWPANSLWVGDLLVVAPDPLSRQLLKDQLRPDQRRSRGLEQRCMERLRSDQAVFWNPSALGSIAGPLAPLLQRFQEGCLTLRLEGQGLSWQGEAAAVEGLLAPGGSTGAPPGAVARPLPPDLLLELQGPSLDQLLQGLLARQLIRDPLAIRYGIDKPQLSLMRRAPFQLRLRPQAQGPFQASLELQLDVGGDRASWQRILDRLARELRQQGLQGPQPPAPVTGASVRPTGSPAGTPAGSPVSGAKPAVQPGASPSPAPQGAPPQAQSAPPLIGASGPNVPAVTTAKPAPPLKGPVPEATWSREDGVVVGGWRWLVRGPSHPQLLLFLGPAPTGSGPTAVVERAGRSQGLELRLRPAAMDPLGLLPPDMPELVKRSQQLTLEVTPQSGAGANPSLSRLTGSLRLDR